MADYDAIIIGAGHNALVCALYLARSGMKIAVLERSDQVGGALRSGSVTLPGYIHDLYATNVSQFSISPAVSDFAAEFAEQKLSFISSAHSYASAYDDGSVMRVYQDIEMTEKEISDKSPLDRSAWRDAVTLFKRTAPKFLPMSFTSLPSAKAAGMALKLAMGSPRDAAKIWKIVRGSARQFVNEQFQSDRVKGLFVPWSYHMDFGPDVPGGALFAFTAGLSGHLRGLCLAKGGAGNISIAMRNIAQSMGVTIYTRSEVSKILIEDGRAVGVKLASGDNMSAKLIVAGITPRVLFGGLVSEAHLPNRFQRKVASFRYGPSTFIIHLALSQPLNWRGAEDLWRFNYVHLCGEIEHVAQTYRDSLAGLLPERPMLVVSQPTSVDSTRAPEGRHVLRIHVRTVPFNIRGDAGGQIRARAWKDAADPFADRIIKLLEEHTGDIENAVLSRNIVSPAEIQAANANLVYGDCVSGSHHLDQNFLNRPFRGWSRYQTPIRNLYMTGASTWPGGGIHGASGYLVAKELLK